MSDTAPATDPFQVDRDIPPEPEQPEGALAEILNLMVVNDISPGEIDSAWTQVHTDGD